MTAQKEKEDEKVIKMDENQIIYTDKTLYEFVQQVNHIGPEEIIKVQVTLDDGKADVCAEGIGSKT